MLTFEFTELIQHKNVVFSKRFWINAFPILYSVLPCLQYSTRTYVLNTLTGSDDLAGERERDRERERERER